jgi:hypothetical protein
MAHNTILNDASLTLSEHNPTSDKSVYELEWEIFSPSLASSF